MADTLVKALGSVVEERKALQTRPWRALDLRGRSAMLLALQLDPRSCSQGGLYGVGIGAVASWISGELAVSRLYLLVDAAQVIVAAVLTGGLVELWLRYRAAHWRDRRTSRRPLAPALPE